MPEKVKEIISTIDNNACGYIKSVNIKTDESDWVEIPPDLITVKGKNGEERKLNEYPFMVREGVLIIVDKPTIEETCFRVLLTIG